MKSPIPTLRYLFSHPLTKTNKLAACLRVLKWQTVTRLFPFPILYPFVEGTHLLIQRGMTGATGNVYAGLQEYAEMGFLLHLLRPGDIFGDIGANVGAFTILASGVAGSNSVSAEPIHSTFIHLRHNVAVNNIESLVQLNNCGIGAEEGKLYFTSQYDTVNHVASEAERGSGITESVDIRMLDQLFPGEPPLLLKIDVEGFEMAVLEGAGRILGEPGLKAIIIELNGACHRYGIMEEEIHQFLLSHNFKPVSYTPTERRLGALSTFDPHGNTIYIRDEDWVKERLITSKKIKIFNSSL
jgi:FkbM family methyltransferase